LVCENKKGGETKIIHHQLLISFLRHKEEKEKQSIVNLI